MLLIKILEDNQINEITINQKNISYFRSVDTLSHGQCTFIKMTCGDEFVVIEPPFEQWQVDSYITPTDY